MKNNMGSIDRIVRIIIALIFSAFYITGTVTGVLAYVLLALGGVFVLTSAINSCPIYSFFGLSTCKKK
jgi:hypothetical protein